MANQIAGLLALIAFAMSLLLGAIETENGFAVVVWRALLAMLGTYVVGYVLGVAAERMVAENVVAAEKKLTATEKNSASSEESTTDGR